ncbi:acyl carrier protein [Solihabitans fulvus]|uniref:Acyl carrier protein n=2 Tax=Solihabitans fulvus TaxID=1892852 RepID=A0A5B2WWR0_9PSEU|nr:acyl carrier protein [Solihabitans fulvus]
MLRPFLKYAGANEITLDSSLRDLGLDSMQAVELLFAIEDTYQVSLPDELLTDTTFATAGNLWAAIESSGVGAEAGAKLC